MLIYVIWGIFALLVWPYHTISYCHVNLAHIFPLNCTRKGQNVTNRLDDDSLSFEIPDPGAPEAKLHEF